MREIMFRFVPTMKCNFRCTYCFVEKTDGTMFDRNEPKKWIEGMRKFSEDAVEFYLWGGEPFLLDGTYEVVRGFTAMPHVEWARIDTNLYFVDRILERCPSPKVKVLCSWHTEEFDFKEVWSRVMALKRERMVGAVNFVASDTNMSFLKSSGHDLDDIIRRFWEAGVFMNVAADFHKGDDATYREFITRYTLPADWDNIHYCYPSEGVDCVASEKFFNVDYQGDISTCPFQGDSVGNFFKGNKL